MGKLAAFLLGLLTVAAFVFAATRPVARPVAEDEPGPEIAFSPRPGPRFGPGGGEDYRPNPVVFDWQPSATGVFPEPAGTVSHVTWNGSALVDAYANSWTMVNTVPQVTTGPWYPNGFSAAPKAGSGPYTNSGIYYKTTLTNDVFDFTGDFTIIALYNCDTIGSDPILFSDMAASNAAGYYVELCRSYSSLSFLDGSGHPTSTNTGGTLGMHAACFGRAGSNGYVKVDQNTSAAAAAGTNTPATSNSAFIGQHQSLSYPFNTGEIYEIVAAPVTPTDALCSAAINQAFAHLATKPVGSALTVTRNATEAFQPTATSPWFYAPPNTLAVTSNGAQVYGAYTANPPYSSTFANAAWTTAAVPGATDASASCPLDSFGTTRMSLIDATTSGTGTGTLQDVASTTERNVFLALATGDSACTVTVSDAAGAGGEAVTLTTSPVRYTKYVAAQHGIKIVATTCTRFCAKTANVTATLVAMPPVETGASPVAQPASIVSAGNPFPAALSTFQIAARATVPTAWSSGSVNLGQWGSWGAANSYGLCSSGPPIFALYDSTTTVKYGATSNPSAVEHVVQVGMRSSTPFFAFDGNESTIVGGTGTGVSSVAPATFAIGPVGYLKRYMLCKTANLTRCQP